MTREQIIEEMQRFQMDIHEIETLLLVEVDRYLASDEAKRKPKGRAIKLMAFSFIDLANISCQSVLLDDADARPDLLSQIDMLRESIADPERTKLWRERLIRSQSIAPSSQRMQ